MAVLLQARDGVEVELRPGARGAFEIEIEGKLVFSKLATGRFPESDEILAHLK